MKQYEIGKNKYEIIKDYKNGFEYEPIKEIYTDYFDVYDYILGDWSYGKLRLKGFCDKENKQFKPINNIDTAEKYIKENGAYECRYFIIKKCK